MHTSILHTTRLRWQHYGELARPDTKQGQQMAALLFGSGGTYSASQLLVRANMLAERQAAVRLLVQPLTELLAQLDEEA